MGQKSSYTNIEWDKHQVKQTELIWTKIKLKKKHKRKKHKVGKTLTKWNKVGQTMLMVGSGTNIE